MALFDIGSKGRMGRTVREQDDVYFDQFEDYSRRRSNRWKMSTFFEIGPLLLFVIGTIVLWLFISFMFGTLTLMFSQMSNIFGDGVHLFDKMGVVNRGGAFISIFLHYLLNIWIFLISAIAAGVGGYVFSAYQRRIYVANTGDDLNTYEGDAYVLTVPEMVAKYRPVPDRGAHFKNVDVTGLVTHIPISNAGIKKQLIPVLEGSDGKPYWEAKKMLPVKEVGPDGKERIKKAYQPLIDEEDGIRQLINVGMTDERYHILHNPKKLIVDQKNNITLADWINENWWIPDYETQRPAGVYLVDESAINVMIVAMTRGNKGQSIINPTIDIWTRQEDKPNIFVNDPKGELYTGFFATLKMRGYDTVVFNLLDSMMTDKFNPLAATVMYARKGYADEPKKVLTQLSDNFFPTPPNTDPFWTKGERMIFEMLCLVLIDIYYEEEREYLDRYSGVYDEARIARDLDEMWSYVTLPNVYRMVAVLATRKYQQRNMDGTEYRDPETGEPMPESDKNMLEELFDLTVKLPKSNIRNMFESPYANLQSMAESEKMRSSLYGLALTDMAFFIEGPVQDLTNASPNESFDLISMSFPRRFQFKFNEDMVEDFGYIGMPVDFELYKDPYFKEPYEGNEFRHSTRVDKLSWAEMRFGGVIPEAKAYVKMVLRPRDTHTDLVYGTYYAEFTKGFEKSLDGRTFLKDPITGEYQIKDGVLRIGELDENGKFTYSVPTEILSSGKEINVFELTEVAYREKPLAVFSVTPPSSLVYVKIVLMIMHSVFNTTIENSYLTKEDQKPLLKTKYMLDEAGNLSYEGAGIQDLDTKLSIGLAQGQEYTLVFQTLQQITDIYGDTADRIISSNTGLNIFLLSNDLDMLETLSQQAGTHHVVRKNSKSVTEQVGVMVERVDSAVNYTTTIEEEPLFSVNRLLRMTNGEALILSTTKRVNNDGKNVRQQPIFNTQDTSLPMAWSLHKYGYMQRSYSMLTVPSQTVNINSRAKIPPFEAMIYKRARQATLAPMVVDKYCRDNNLSEIEFELLDYETTSREIMRKVNAILRGAETRKATGAKQDIDIESLEDVSSEQIQHAVNKETGMVVDIGEDGKAKVKGVKKDLDALSYARQRKVELDENSKKIYNRGQYSYDEMQTGQFTAALGYALAEMEENRVNGSDDWKLVESDDGLELYYRRKEIARETYSEQRQQLSIDSGDGADVVVEDKVARVKGWTFDKDDILDALMETPDWSYIFGNGFTRTLSKEFSQSYKTNEMD